MLEVECNPLVLSDGSDDGVTDLELAGVGSKDPPEPRLFLVEVGVTALWVRCFNTGSGGNGAVGGLSGGRNVRCAGPMVGVGVGIFASSCCKIRVQG